MKGGGLERGCLSLECLFLRNLCIFIMVLFCSDKEKKHSKTFIFVQLHHKLCYMKTTLPLT